MSNKYETYEPPEGILFINGVLIHQYHHRDTGILTKVNCGEYGNVFWEGGIIFNL